MIVLSMCQQTLQAPRKVLLALEGGKAEWYRAVADLAALLERELS